MNTQLSEAKNGRATDEMKQAARTENVPVDVIVSEVAAGKAVVLANPAHRGLVPAVVGRAFRTKVNANLGRSPELSDVAGELGKLHAAVSAGSDFVMDLSVGPDLAPVRVAMLAEAPVALGTVPIYEALSRVDGCGTKLEAQLLLDVISEQAEQGVDFMTLHAGILRGHVDMASKRVMGIVSRGGSILAEWMTVHERENPLYERWPEVMEICRKHDVTISLGDGLRPGCLADASDDAQFAELDVLGELVRACRDVDVQSMVEGPGHVPFDQIQMNMEREQEVCDGAPFYVLGPVVTDAAPGYDHITSSIGATAAAYYGASLLCAVTPAEHLGLPTLEEVHRGVISYRIAAHAADVARKLPGARDLDDSMSRARMEFDWEKQFELALDGDTARKRYKEGAADSGDTDYCSMCGKDFCAVRTTRRIREAAS